MVATNQGIQGSVRNSSVRVVKMDCRLKCCSIFITNSTNRQYNVLYAETPCLILGIAASKHRCHEGCRSHPIGTTHRDVFSWLDRDPRSCDLTKVRTPQQL